MVRKKPQSESIQEVELEFGEKSFGMTARSRTYFFYVTPTKRETSMKDCPHLRVAWMQPIEETDDGTRVTRMGLTVTQPVTIKMVCMPTSFGRPRSRDMIYIDLDPFVEMFEI